MGARPMARLIQDKIKRPLAEQILFGRLSEKGGDVFIQLKGDELVFDYEDEPAEAV
jgi:ATP-dependent Clp protease ATP-binding subunit ClpA